jgi:glycosyltransferase involved in cell wall biosynthesis
MKYVLITPAHNEEAFIQKTLDSVVAQTLLPERLVIVDDGSTDRTAEIVDSCEKQYPLDRTHPAPAALRPPALPGKYMPLTSVLIVLHR